MAQDRGAQAYGASAFSQACAAEIVLHFILHLEVGILSLGEVDGSKTKPFLSGRAFFLGVFTQPASVLGVMKLRIAQLQSRGPELESHVPNVADYYPRAGPGNQAPVFAG